MSIRKDKSGASSSLSRPASRQVVAPRLSRGKKAPTAEQIAIRAYERWLDDGRPEGRHELHWAAAESELRGR